MMHATPGRRPLVSLLTLTITVLSLKCVSVPERPSMTEHCAASLSGRECSTANA